MPLQFRAFDTYAEATKFADDIADDIGCAVTVTTDFYAEPFDHLHHSCLVEWQPAEQFLTAWPELDDTREAD